jgi:hypothetical protein
MKTFLTAVLAASIGVATAAKAEPQSFDATCTDATECKVTVTGEALTTSRGLTINAEDIVYWSVSDNTKKTSLGWCFWLGVRCYPKEDIRFSIKYMDSEGRRQITQIGFFNNKPARSFASILSVFSGLEAGQINGVSNSDNRPAALNPESVPPFADVTTDNNAAPKGAEQVGKPGGSTPAVQY